MQSLNAVAIAAMAASQVTRSPRTCGCSSRSSRPTVSPSALPLTQSLPRLAGCLGSPRTSTAPPLRAVAMTPQPTPQYGHVVRMEVALNSGGGRYVEQQLIAYRPDVCFIGDQVAQ